jgi:hypothetical protein
MSNLKNWDIGGVISQINAMSRESIRLQDKEPISWDIKQDLYHIKWIVDQALKNCPVFPGEQKWVKDKKKKTR